MSGEETVNEERVYKERRNREKHREDEKGKRENVNVIDGR